MRMAAFSAWLCVPLLLLGCASKQLAARHTDQHKDQLAALEAQRLQLVAIQATLAEIETEQMNLRARQEEVTAALAERMPSAGAPEQEWRAGVDQRLDAIQAKLDRPTPGAAPTPRPGSPDPAAVYRMPIDGAQTRGSAGAKVTLVVCSDFQCPFCARVRSTLDDLAKEYGDDLRIVFKNNPLPMHIRAAAAAAAAEAAGKQGKFWAMHDRLFENARELTDENFARWAGELGLEAARFERDRNDPKTAERISAQSQQCTSLGARGTPAFFINGRYLSGAQPIESFRTLIDEEAKKADAMLRKGVKPKKLYEAIIKGGKTAP